MPRHERPRGDAARASMRWTAFAVLWACVWGGLTLVFLFVAVAQWTGLDPRPDMDAALGGIAAALLTGSIGSAGVFIFRARREEPRLPAAPVPPLIVRPGKQYPLPRLKSAARQPMVDLAEAETALAELLRQLGDSPGGPSSDVIEQAWHTARDTATRLREVASRLEAVELAVKQSSRGDRPALEEGAAALRTSLDQGLEGYRGLIAAAGRVVLAGTPVVATNELVDATESLAGLAEALRELSAQD